MIVLNADEPMVYLRDVSFRQRERDMVNYSLLSLPARHRRESGSRNRIMSQQDVSPALPRDDRLARHRKDISRQKRTRGKGLRVSEAIG